MLIVCPRAEPDVRTLLSAPSRGRKPRWVPTKGAFEVYESPDELWPDGPGKSRKPVPTGAAGFGSPAQKKE